MAMSRVPKRTHVNGLEAPFRTGVRLPAGPPTQPQAAEALGLTWFRRIGRRLATACRTAYRRTGRQTKAAKSLGSKVIEFVKRSVPAMAPAPYALAA